MGEIQVAIEQNIHTTPFSVKRWDGACLRGWSELPSLLCAKLQQDVTYSPFKRGVHHKIDLLMRPKVLGSKDCLLTD
jgi:hypothetical protein